MNNQNNISENKILLKVEYVFVIIALLFGVLFAFLNPPFQSYNEDKNFVYAFSGSEGNYVKEKFGSETGLMTPRSVINTISAFRGKEITDKNKIEKGRIDNYAQILLNKNDRSFYSLNNFKSNPIATFPNILGISIGKIFNPNPVYLLWFSRITGLIFYIIIIFFALKIIPVFKNVLFLLALSPVALYQSASVSHSVMALSLSFLLIAVILNFALKKESIGILNIIWLAIISFILCFSPGVYFLLPFLILAIPRNKFSNPLYYYLLLIFFVLLTFLPGWIFGSVLNGSGTVNSDFVIDNAKNLSFHLTHPFAAIGNIFMNFLAQGNNWFAGAIASFGVPEAIPSGILVLIHVLIILTIALFDNKINFRISSRFKYVSLIAGLLGIFLTVGLYLIIGSPVGANLVYGLRGYYFLPFVPLLIFVLYNNSYRNEIVEKYGSILLGIYSIILLSVIAVFINGYFYAG